MRRRNAALGLLLAVSGCSLLVGDDAIDDPGADLTTTCGDQSLQLEEGQFVTLPRDSAVFGLDDFTIGVWAKPSVVSGRRTLISNHDSDSGWVMYIENSTPRVDVFTATGTCSAGAFGGSGVPIGEWRHFAFSFTQLDNGNNLVSFFENGDLVDDNDCPGELEAYDGPPTLGNDLTTSNRRFRGQLDDVVVCSPGNLADFDNPRDPAYCQDPGAKILAAFPIEPTDPTDQLIANAIDEGAPGLRGTIDRPENEDPEFVPGDECD